MTAVISASSAPTAAAARFPAVRPAGYFPVDADPAALGAFYREHGWFVLEDAFDRAGIAELVADTAAICRGERGPIRGVEPPPPGLSDEEVLRRYLCIHFPHKISATMRRALSHPPVVRALVAAVGQNVKCMQSMLFIKASGKPGQAWHQDEDYIPTRDRSLIGAWIALDRATVENGGLWVIPGSHRHGILWEQVWHGDRRFDCAWESRGFPYTDADAIPVEVEAGAVVFFHGYLLHRSLPNRAPAGTFRRALVNHYMSGESLLPWHHPKPGTSMAKADYRDIVVVAGIDPYSAHGYEDIAQPSVRSDGRSGCVDWMTQAPLPYADAAAAESEEHA